MPADVAYRPLSDSEIAQLEWQDCRCDNWQQVEVTPEIKLDRIQRTIFSGSIRLANPEIPSSSSSLHPSGIYDARLHDCTVGAGVRIAGVRNCITGYDVGREASIEDVGLLEASGNSCFGNGVQVSALNEGGGREVTIVNELDAQIAYLLCLHRYRPALVEHLNAWLQELAESRRGARGIIGVGASIRGVQHIKDVQVGDYAVIDGAARLTNGSILSAKEARTTIGTMVEAQDFIVAESSVVDGGAMLASTFVGQGCRIGRQFSAEHSLFFANCEAFHGEAVSLFAGPYTVTHHKSSLLIAGLFSFYNAGSGTNQSNHLYKLGPVHEGKLERGCKTGSLSYLMWPARIGAFSVVLGKHTGNLDTKDFPFSHIEAAPDGKSYMIPGFNLSTVGTVRDGQKWPSRDRRTGEEKRDRIHFDVLSPLTVSAMMRGERVLGEKKETTGRKVDSVLVSGINIKRVLLRTGQRFYRSGIRMYLLEKIFSRMELAIAEGQDPLNVLSLDADDREDEIEWADLAGQIMPVERIESIENGVNTGRISSLSELRAALDAAFEAYSDDEWTWIQQAYSSCLKEELPIENNESMVRIADAYEEAMQRFLGLVRSDAEREFDRSSHTGFGADGTSAQVDMDFQAVRGLPEVNGFVEEMKCQLEDVRERVDRFKSSLVE